ncbi:MAG: hypothetical protein WCD22_03825, partial [Acinetobacter sp.]
MKPNWLKNNNSIIEDSAKIAANILADFFRPIATSNRSLFKVLALPPGFAFLFSLRDICIGYASHTVNNPS